MIRDHMRIRLLSPGLELRHFGKLPSCLDEVDERPAAEQLGERWRPIQGSFRFEGSALCSDGHGYELLGAIHLPHELVMLFESDLVATVQSDRSFEVSQLHPQWRKYRKAPEIQFDSNFRPFRYFRQSR